MYHFYSCWFKVQSSISTEELVKTKQKLHYINQNHAFEIFNFTPKKRKSRHFWHTIKNVGCFTHLFWTNCQSFCIFLFNYKVTRVIWVKNAPDFGKLYRKRIFSYQFLTILPESKNILHKCHLCHLWQIPCLYFNFDVNFE